MASHAVEAGGTLPAPSGPASDAQAALEKDATVRDLMSPPVGVFHGTDTVAETIENLREQTKTAFITYCYLTDMLAAVGAEAEWLARGDDARFMSDVALRLA